MAFEPIFRSFTLDSNVDEPKTKASYKDGLLELTPPQTGNFPWHEIKGVTVCCVLKPR